MKLIRKSLLVLLAIGVLAPACNHFEELNENPNEPTQVSSDVLLTQSQRETVNVLVTESFLLSNNIAQLTTKLLRTEVDVYNWNAFPTVWEGLYSSLTDIVAVEAQAVAAGNEKMQGVAKTWKAFIFSVLTNTYGDIPYTEAVQGALANLTPAYDAQADIYADLLAQLEEANTLLTGKGVISGDIIYNNEAAQWQKFTNSLRLRLLMTASSAYPNAATEFAAIAENQPIMSSNADNAILDYLGGFPNQFPLLPIKDGDFAAVGISQGVVEVLKGYADPRLLRYARPNNDDYSDTSAVSGSVNGANSGNCPKTGSLLGPQYWDDPNLVQASDLGLPTANGVIMTFAEVSFLLAEAAEKGWITDDTEMHYRNGIQASHQYHQVDYTPFGWADFDDFYSNSGVAFSETMDVWEQKWLALFFHGMEPFFEVRRWYTESGNSFENIPFLSAPCENLNNGQLPTRFLYPGQEQSLNQASYQEAIDRMGGSDDINAEIWLVQ